MKISREWATPLTIGAFALMTVTGILMFFHLDTGLNKTAHEWLSWVLVAGVATHVVVNWQGFKRYFLSSTLGRSIIAVSILIIAASFYSPPGQERGMPPPVMALKAVTAAPLTSVAVLASKPVEQLLADLGTAGIRVSGPESNLDSALAGDHELEAKAMTIIFASK